MNKKSFRNIKTLLFYWFITCPVSGQISVIDSLKTVLNDSQLSTESRAETMSELGREYMFIDPSISGEYFKKALSLADSSENPIVKAHVLRNLGTLLAIQGYFAEGVRFLVQAKNIFTKQNDSMGLGNSFISLGIIYEDQGILDSAIVNTKRAVEIFKKIKAEERLGICYNNIGSQYNLLENLDSSEHFINLAADINQRIGNRPALVSNIRLKAKNALGRGDSELCGKLCGSIIEMFNKKPGESNLEAVADCACMLSEIYLKENREDSAIYYLELSLELAEKQGYFLQLKRAYLMKLRILIRTGNYGQIDSALSYFEYSNETFLKNERINRMSMIRWVEDLIKKDSEINNLNEAGRENFQTIKTQRLQLIIIGLILIFITVFAVVNNRFYRKFKQLNNSLKKSSEELKQKKQEVEYKNKQLIHQQEKLSEERSFVRLLINGLPLFMGLTDEKGNFIIANRQYYKQFNLGGIRIEGKSYKEILPGFVLKKHEPRILNGLKGTASEFEESYKSNDGNRRRHFHGKYIPQFDKNGKVKQLIFFTAEITEIKEAQQKLQEMNDSKNKLFSIISHDFKSPINTVLGFSDLLMKNVDFFSKEELQTVATDMNRSVRKTLTLAENLLKWAQTQMDQVQINQQEILLLEGVNYTIDQLKPVAEKKNVRLVIDIDKEIQVYLDPNHMDLILRNITINAIKFSNKGGKVSISSNVKDEMVEITIADEGVGMEQETVDQLFNSYVKSNPGTEGEVGTGLGLMLCKEYVEINGGRIRVESELGKGSKFHFTVSLLNPQPV
ncbi:MAG: ATP-binding protein [Bacteroidota bacterium]